MEENRSSQGLIEVHVKMRRISIGNKLINKANHTKNKVKEESILVMGFGLIFISLLIEQVTCMGLKKWLELFCFKIPLI